MIVAKAVIPDQYWILRDQDRKIGNIQAENDGYRVRINDQVVHVKTLAMLRERVEVDFENTIVDTPADISDNMVHGYPTNATIHNAIWDVKRHLPLWTRDQRSKSWFAAGWYRVRQHRSWRVVMCPKVILLDRYDYRGPFHNRQQAENDEPTH